MDLLIGTLIPFAMMLICSVLLIKTIYITRKRIIHSSTAAVKRKIKRDIKFCITLVFLDVTFVVLNLPINIYFLDKNWSNHICFLVFDDLFYLSYSVNFFVYLAVNSEFRYEFVSIFYNRKSEYSY